MQAGRFQRFQKAARQPDGDAVLVPQLLALARLEFHPERIGAGRAVKVRQQHAFGLGIVDELAGIDVAIASAVLQRNAPLPARAVRGGAGVGGEVFRALARHRNRPVTRQPVRPVIEPHAQRLVDEQPAKAGAIDEQVRADHFAVVQRHAVDEAILGAQRHVHDLALAPPHAAFLRIGRQKPRKQRGVEVERVGDLAERAVAHLGLRAHELVFQRGGGVDRIGGEITGTALRVGLQPVMVHPQPFPVLPDHAEAVDIALPLLPPVDELDAQLEAALGAGHELVLVQPQQLVVFLDRGDRRLAHADRADILGFDQHDLVQPLEQPREQRRRHPPGRAAPGDKNALDRRHVRPSPLARF